MSQDREEENEGESGNEEEKQVDEADVLRIMVTSDNHLGIKENDRILREDSFTTFEEILRYSKKNEVDMMIVGGDMFHYNKPSRETFFRTTKLLRQYCLGDGDISVEIKSNQKTNFRSSFGKANYLDPNYNVSLPLFAIHGNHDDPTGEDALSALDVLAVNGLVNYFGRTALDPVILKPILLKKGRTRVALYGLGYIRDVRLFQCFKDKKVHFYRPPNADKWFSILVMHQNRHQIHTAKANIKEEWLPEFLDLVIWGHEHEQNIEPSQTNMPFSVVQPGSTVVNSFVAEEAKTKKCGILEIHKHSFRMSPKTLYSTRPFVFDTIMLKDVVEERHKTDMKKIGRAVTLKVEDMLKKAKLLQQTQLHKEYLKIYQSLKLPLIRLKIEYGDGYASLNPQRFGQQFVEKVANPSEMVHFYRRKKTQGLGRRGKGKGKGKNQEVEGGADDDVASLTTDQGIEDFIRRQLTDEGVDLEVLPQPHMWEAVRLYVTKKETKAIDRAVSKALKSAQKNVWNETIKNKKSKGRKRKTNRNSQSNSEDEKSGESEGKEEEEEEEDGKLLGVDDVALLLKTYQTTLPTPDDELEFGDGKDIESQLGIGGGAGKDDESGSGSEVDFGIPEGVSSGVENNESEGGTGTGRTKKGRARARKIPARKKPRATKAKKKTKTPAKRRRRRKKLEIVSSSGGAEDEDGWVPEKVVDDDFSLGQIASEEVEGDEDDAEEVVVEEEEEVSVDTSNIISGGRGRRSGRNRKRKREVIKVESDESEPPKKKRKVTTTKKKKRKKRKKKTFVAISSSSSEEEEANTQVSQASGRSRRFRKKR